MSIKADPRDASRILLLHVIIHEPQKRHDYWNRQTRKFHSKIEFSSSSLQIVSSHIFTYTHVGKLSRLEGNVRSKKPKAIPIFRKPTNRLSSFQPSPGNKQWRALTGGREPRDGILSEIRIVIIPQNENLFCVKDDDRVIGVRSWRMKKFSIETFSCVKAGELDLMRLRKTQKCVTRRGKSSVYGINFNWIHGVWTNPLASLLVQNLSSHLERCFWMKLIRDELFQLNSLIQRLIWKYSLSRLAPQLSSARAFNRRVSTKGNSFHSVAMSTVLPPQIFSRHSMTQIRSFPWHSVT